jgi:hypothetical protein
MLYRSNKVMYDRLTESLWSQLRGEPIVGELVGSGIKLEYFPVALATWGEWRADHPDTKVQSPDTGYYSPRSYEREDNPRSIYFAYREDPETMFPIWNRDEQLAPKQLVLGVAADGAYKAYSIDALQQDRIVNDNVGGVDLVVVGSSLSSDALAFRSEGNSFMLPEDVAVGLPATLLDGDGAVWHVERDRIWKDDDPSEALPLHPANVSFWFGWYITHPDTLLYGATGN